MCLDAYCSALCWWWTHCCPPPEPFPPAASDVPVEVVPDEGLAEAAAEFSDVLTDPHIQIKLTREEREGMQTVELD